MDDILITGTNLAAVSKLISDLHHTFTLKDMGPLHYFLGIKTTYPVSGVIHINQSKYIKDLLLKAGMDAAKPILATRSSLLQGQLLSLTLLFINLSWVAFNMLLSLSLRLPMLSIKWLSLCIIL